MLINNCIERGSENTYFLFIVLISSSSSPQYENNIFLIKCTYTSNNFYAILAWCCGLTSLVGKLQQHWPQSVLSEVSFLSSSYTWTNLAHLPVSTPKKKFLPKKMFYIYLKKPIFHARAKNFSSLSEKNQIFQTKIVSYNHLRKQFSEQTNSVIFNWKTVFLYLIRTWKTIFLFLPKKVKAFYFRSFFNLPMLIKPNLCIKTLLI